MHISSSRGDRRLALLGGLFLLGGCAIAPPKSELPNFAEVQDFANEQSLAAPGADWPSDRWWREYGDPQLIVLIEEGLEGATDLRIAEARFQRAVAITGRTRASLLPSISASGEAGITQQSDNYLVPEGFMPRGWPDYGQLGLSLNWELDFWGRNRAALAAVQSEAEAAQAEAAATRLAVSAGIADAYASLAGLYAERDAALDAIEVRKQTSDLMQGRMEQDLENAGAVDRANAALAIAEGELAALDEAIALTRNRIAALLGAGPDRGLAIARPEVRALNAFGLPEHLPAELIGRRPDIIAGRLRAEAAASRIKQSRAAFYPNVNLVGLVGVQALGVDKIFESGSDFGSAAPAVTLPIFEGGRLRSQYRAAESEFAAAVAEYDGALVEALHEVADAAASQRALGRRLSSAEAAEQSAEAAWRIANNRYRGGLATYLDVLAAEDVLISTRRQVASLKTRAFALDVAMVRALGGGFQSERLSHE